MTKNSARIDFNISILEESLDRDISNIMQELAAKPNKLLMRCIKKQAGDRYISFTNEEVRFLSSNFIAKTEWDDGDTYLKEFMPPWSGFFRQLGSRLNKASLNLQNP